MTYEEALRQSKSAGAAHATDPALMASFCESTVQTLCGAVAPQLVWAGAQARGMSTTDLAVMCANRPQEVADLQWAA
ncbi:hypothetical protein [Streptomyces pakalii]|uniref:Uncharacterized protein n=1 Tax=Streptomyces pakalii TaxID=3036494 RepID=A0ABT7DHT9_9ACTN|nr:hypothetical protein [Streptomyces pakalii]MDJ1645153.1 hypothetical protein [Streptomyces pakalii]